MAEPESEHERRRDRWAEPVEQAMRAAQDVDSLDWSDPAQERLDDAASEWLRSVRAAGGTQ